MFDSNCMESSTKVRVTGVSMSTTSSGSKVTQRTLLGYADKGANRGLKYEMYCVQNKVYRSYN